MQSRHQRPEPGAVRADQFRLLADYARYTDNDALCCPSRTTSVTFLIDRDAPAARPVSAGTYANP